MIFVLIGISLLFIAIGYIITERNAKYLLSGYNTMSEAERKTVDIHSFLPAFKKFHLILGISLFAIGSLLYYLVGESAAVLFLGVYPLVAYFYFLILSRKYYSGVSIRKQNFAFVILAVTLIFVVVLLSTGNKAININMQPGKIEFDGMYGEVLAPSAIESVELVDQLPVITLRTNGFASGHVRKGYFKTGQGEIIKLLLDTDQAPFLFIQKKDGEKIYIAVKGKSMQDVMDELKIMFKDIKFIEH